MADDQNQSNTPTPSDSTQAETPRVPAPETPVPGAITAAPLTGGGPHRGEPEKKKAEDHGVKKGPPKPPVSPPKQPPRQPPRPSQGSTGQQPPQAQPGPVAQQVYPQPGTAGQPHMSMMMPPGHIHDPAVSSLLAQTLNNQRTQAQKFLLVELPEDDWPRLHEFETIEQLLAGIKERLGSNCHLFPFLGHKLAITQGPNRFLITPYGPLPLFDIPEPDHVDEAEYGWVGESLVHPEPPTSDEEEDEEDEEAEAEGEEGQVVQPGVPADATDEEDDTPMFDEDDEQPS